MGTRGAWANDFLRALGNTNPDEKTQNLVAAWTKGENTRAKYNPLATTLNYGENTKFNNCCGGNGVKNYKTRQQGIEASIMTLQGKHSGYSEIIAGLRNNKSEDALSGMKKSPWGTNFLHVELVWRSSDVRGEPLKSEEEGSVSGGDWSADVPKEPDIAQTIRSIPEDERQGLMSNPVTAMSVQKSLKIVLGIGIAVTGILMLIYIASKTDTAKLATKVVTKGLV